MVTREQIIDILEEIALLLELKGENPFKSRAYRMGAETIQTYSGDFLQKARDNELSEIKGFGDALAKKVHQLVTTGKMDYYEELRSQFPASLFQLFEIPGLGAKKIKALYEKLGVKSVADLQRVCESGEAARLERFGAKTAEKILAAIAFRQQNAERFLLGEVAPRAAMITEWLRAHPEVTQASVAGSFRRGKETVHDLDFIVATRRPQAVMDDFVRQAFVADVIAHGQTKSSVHLQNGLQCDLRAVSGDEYPFALVYFTGSKEHNVTIRGRARDLGYTLNEYRLAPLEGSKAKPRADIHTEADVYKVLGLAYIDPALRENAGEIQAAESGDLPKLIDVGNLRGTFHNHTTASDGHNTLEEMAEAAGDLGLEYLGIADHSKASFQAHGLDAERLLAQVDEIRKYNRSKKKAVHLFAGNEVDILKDGRLDFPDAILSQLDYVVASVHSIFTLSEKEQTKRIVKAVENPHVTMLGHLTGRLLLRRDPYAVDVPKIIDACAAAGTWIELNADPRRLDMDWRWWHRARDKGVKCVINPDAHRTTGLQNLYFGVQAARKGWLRREDVMNCLPLDKIQKALKAKKEA